MNYNTYIISINKMQKFKDMGTGGKELEIALSGIKLNDFIKIFVTHLKEEHKLDSEQVAGLFSKSIPKKDIIPISIFNNSELSCLEAIVKYLKEELKLKFSKIARLTNRSSKTIWATYHKAAKKLPLPFGEISKEIMIPVSALSDRSFSTLESVVRFIKNLDYTNHEVAQMLHLDDRTIWTVYDRVKKKRGMK